MRIIKTEDERVVLLSVSEAMLLKDVCAMIVIATSKVPQIKLPQTLQNLLVDIYHGLGDDPESGIGSNSTPKRNKPVRR